jgi:hypothetical protein
MFPQAIIIIAYASHCQIDDQISFDNYHLNFRDVKTRQNLIVHLISYVNGET